MKVLAINGSPRKNWNTAKLLDSALAGAQENGAEVKRIDLYDYEYKGCISCFGCHLKTSMNNLHCFYKDGLTEVLDACLKADAIILGAPIYYSQLTGQFRTFMERWLFPIDTYYADEKGHRVTKMKKAVPTALIIPMNMKEEHMHALMRDGEIFKTNANIIAELLNAPCHLQFVYNTLQFKNYDPYTVNIFDPQEKAERNKNVFPEDLSKANTIGKTVVAEALKLNA